MYDIISNIINHSWVSNYNGDQSYIYYIVSAVIVIFLVFLFDSMFSFFRSLTRIHKK